MPMLPSGRFVEIMSDRARYHATRTGMRVKPGMAHSKLYPLVDILVEHPRAGIKNGQRLGFSGHTLDDAFWLKKWGASDRKFFQAWIREAQQVRVIEQARRRLLAEDETPRERVFDYPEKLYSYLRHRVEILDMPRADARQWRRTLRNLDKVGVQREELERSGILDFLSALPDTQSIDKTVLIDTMDFTAIRPRLTYEFVCAKGCTLPFAEVAQKLKGYELQLAGLPSSDEDIGVIRLRSEVPSYKIGVLWPKGRANSKAKPSLWFVLGPYGAAIDDATAAKRFFFDTQEQAVDAARSNALRNNRARCDLVASANYDYMTLHGGEQYREWLVTLPEFAQTHFTGHYMERNVLVHIRTKIRTSKCGARVLFIEELQSDWHQALARKQSRGIIPRAPYKKEWPALALKLMIMHAAAENLDGIAWADGAVQELRYDRSLPPLRRLYDKTMPAMINALAKSWSLQIGHGEFDTRSPWLHAVRRADVWRVEGGTGKFATRARYTKDEAMRLIERHSKAVTLPLPMVLFSDAMREHINTHGLPLFGTKTSHPPHPVPICRDTDQS